MSVYERGNVWWYKFKFHGQEIRESTHSDSKTLAIRAERQRRRELEEGVNRLKADKRPMLFSVHSRQYLEANTPHWSRANLRIESYNVKNLSESFGRMLLSDIAPTHISKYQAKRKADEASNRTVNMEVGTLRAILRKHRLWANLQPDVRMLRARDEVGRALTQDEESRLLAACRASRSRSLYPAALLSIHTGLRNQELRLLRWRQVDMLEGTVTVGKSKTAGGEGRTVPLSQVAMRSLQEWRSQFPDAKPDHYVFPSERYGAVGGGKDGQFIHQTAVYDTDPTKPCGAWKASWDTARTQAGVTCRWHDLRHTFVSRIAEGQVSDATIMALAGHLSRKMMERYSHTRNEAKRQAVAVFDGAMGVRTVDGTAQ